MQLSFLYGNFYLRVLRCSFIILYWYGFFWLQFYITSHNTQLLLQFYFGSDIWWFYLSIFLATICFNYYYVLFISFYASFIFVNLTGLELYDYRFSFYLYSGNGNILYPLKTHFTTIYLLTSSFILIKYSNYNCSFKAILMYSTNLYPPPSVLSVLHRKP